MPMRIFDYNSPEPEWIFLSVIGKPLQIDVHFFIKK